MSDITDIWKNIPLRDAHARQRRAVCELVPALNACGHKRFLSLYRYVSGCPERFFLRPVYSDFLAFLESQHLQRPTVVKHYLDDFTSSLHHALFSLSEVNSYPWHDWYDKVNEYQEFRFLDQHVHPAYLRLLEATFFPLSHVVAYMTRLNRGKRTEGLDLFNVVQELKESPLHGVALLYHHIVRNGIAHGGVSFGQWQVEFSDKHGATETLSPPEMVQLFDDLVDTCNALAFALTVFLLCHLGEGYKLPQHALIEELRAETSSPWWQVDGALDSRLSNIKQLVVYARPASRDHRRVLYLTFFTAALAESLTPGYDRYLVSLQPKKGATGVAIFKGARLAEIREAGPESLEDYKDVLDEGAYLYWGATLKLPRFFWLFDTLWQVFRLNLPGLVSDSRAARRKPTTLARTAEIHRNGWWAILHARVVITAPTGLLNKASVRAVSARIVARALHLARSQVSRFDRRWFLPLGWGRVSVFRRDFRKRKLVSFGLAEDLICTVQVARTHKIRSPDILDSTIEISGSLRIAWNKAWLDSVEG